MAGQPCDRRNFLQAIAAGGGLLLVGCHPPPPDREAAGAGYDWSKHYWGYAVDTTRCIGCCACMRACRDENDVPASLYRTWVERYEIDEAGHVSVDVAANDEHIFAPRLPRSGGGEPRGLEAARGEAASGRSSAPAVSKAFFVPKICNHCAKSVCSQVCPVGASYQTKDGVVLVDPKRCIGCGYCVQACPYGTRFINPITHLADKCTLCYHRITRGLAPACVAACPTGSRVFGDLRDPRSPLSTVLRQRRYRLLRPELGTHPKCYYLGLDLEVV